MPRRNVALAAREISTRILVLRDRKVIIDADLAELYGVTTKRLNQQVRRNKARFPADFMFELSVKEKNEVVANCIHLEKLKYHPTAPLAFTEHGSLMAASVLNTEHAVEMSLYVVRAFVRLREALGAHKALAAKLAEVEKATETLVVKHDALAATTRAQFKQVFAAIRMLMAPPPESRKRPIGFVYPKES